MKGNRLHKAACYSHACTIRTLFHRHMCRPGALLFLLLLWTGVAPITAAARKEQFLPDRVITLSVTNMPIRHVLPLVQQQTGIEFIYSPNAIDLEQKITYKGSNVTLEAFLQSILLPLHIGYKSIDNKIVLYAMPREKGYAAPAAYDRVIRGRVVDDAQAPLPGASVKVKGTSIGAVTDANGNFSLTAPTGSTELEVSFIGYVTQSVAITGETVQVVLQRAVTTQGEVVVTALGISKSNRRIGYATTKIGGEVLNKARESNVAYSLEGQVPGLNVSGVNSGPGGSASILIRGMSNFTGATGPLFVIDGVPMDNTQKGAPTVYGGADLGDGISSINPDDIESIVVLKGSTASALYGVRAANGVIQITTKSGKGQQGVGVEVNSNFTLASVIDLHDFQKVYGHGLNGLRPQNATDLTTDNLESWGEKLDGSPAIGMDGKMHPYSAVSNQYGKFYRVAPVSTNTLALTSGGEKGNMRFSLSYLDNPSVIPNSGLKRTTANLNLNQSVLDRLKLTMMANYIDEQVTLRPFLNDMSRNANFTMALLPANVSPDYLKPGYNLDNGYENAMNSDGYMPNPWFVVNKTVNNESRKRLISATSLRYDILKGLYVQARTGFDLINDDALNIEPTGIGFSRPGSLQWQNKAQTFELNMDAMAGYSRPLSHSIDMDLTAGGNIRKFRYDKEGTSGTQWKQPFLYTVTNLTFTTPIYEYKQIQTNSAYYTLDLALKDFLTIGTTGRYDVFSTLPAGNRSIFTPSVSGSFVFSDLARIPGLDFGKLRVSYAQTSGEATPYQTSVYYKINDQTNNGLPSGATLDQVANINLQPYRLSEFETGLELKGLGNRLGLDITYFHRRTKGELISKQISIATGYNYSYEKLGATQNQGIELMLTGTPVKTRTFTWTTAFNFTQVDNKLVSIDGTANPAPCKPGNTARPWGPSAMVLSLPLCRGCLYPRSWPMITGMTLTTI